MRELDEHSFKHMWGWEGCPPALLSDVAKMQDFVIGRCIVTSHFTADFGKEMGPEPLRTWAWAGPGHCDSVVWSFLPWTEGLQVQFLVRAHTQVVGSIPGWGTYKKATNQSFSFTSMFLFLFASHSPPFSLSKSNEKYVLR